MRNIVIKMEQLYKKISMPVEQIIMPIILLFWPLIKVSQGVDVSDSTYSLGNYLFADKLDGVWVISTFLSNLTGNLIVRLPEGNTLLGANIYTGLFVSAIALACYYVLRRDFTAPVMFLGEFVAISFCWIPTGILYNYLTYLLFTVGALLIYLAIRNDSDRLLGLAGIVLGLNVFVRIPNLAEMALIIVVWAMAVYDRSAKKENGSAWPIILRKTGICVAGYVIGALIPFLLIIAIYGVGGISEMITGLSAISGSSKDYTLFGMIIATLKAYVRSFKWIAIIVAVIFAGTIMMAALKNSNALKWFGRVAYTIIVGVMLRFMWGRGMFTFRYYEDYTAMFEWGMFTLYLAIICATTVLIKKNYNLLLKTYALITLVMVIITPLGSNNYTCQNLNNMFLVIPFIIYVTGGWLYKGVHRIRLEGVMYGCNFPWMSMLIILGAVVIIQTTLFHVNFVFRDGMDGTPRDAVIGENVANDSSIKVIKGMRTGSSNAKSLTELCEYVASNSDIIKSAVYWGDCPGLSFILQIPSGISTTWTDLDSYGVDRFDLDMIDLSLSDEADTCAIIWHTTGVPSGMNADVKQDILFDYIASRHMEVVFENDEYVIYQ